MYVLEAAAAYSKWRQSLRCLGLSRLWQQMVGSQESQASFSGLLIAVGHSVALLDSRDLLLQAALTVDGKFPKIVTTLA